MAHDLGMLQVLVVARDRLIVDAVSEWLDAQPGLSAWGENRLADATSSAMIRQPNVMLVGIDLNGDVISFIRRHSETPGSRVLLLGDPNHPHTVVRCLHAGAAGVVDRSAPLGLVLQSVLAVAAGATVVPPDVVPHVLATLRASSLPADEWQQKVMRLSDRELEILRWLMAGASRSVIAQELYLSVNTVRTHVHNLLAKLEVHSSLEAVVIGRKAGVQPIIPRDPGAIDSAIPDRRSRPRP